MTKIREIRISFSSIVQSEDRSIGCLAEKSDSNFVCRDGVSMVVA